VQIIDINGKIYYNFVIDKEAEKKGDDKG